MKSPQHNLIVVFMLPAFLSDGNLPAGIHEPDDWNELEARFGGNPTRTRLLDGLRRVIADLRAAGCTTLYLDGSFVTAKPHPGDFDACWDITGVDPNLLNPILLDFSARRAAQKMAYGGELFPAQAQAAPGRIYLDFLQTDKHTGGQKGLVVLDLRKLRP